jgi:hypothetical protein
VATFAGIFPAYNARNCTSARVYDTSDCQKLRAAGIGLGIGGVVAAFVGFVLLMSGGTTQAAGAGGTKQAAGGGTYAQAPSGGFQPPESSASDAAREAIDEIRSQNPGTIPPAQVTGRNNGGATTLDVKNTTEYTLHVFLSGPRSAVLNLPPGYSQTLTIVPGQYEIAARVDAFNVRPFYGTQPFSGGNAYGETFYIATR